MSTLTVQNCLERSAKDERAHEEHLRRGEQLARTDRDWRGLAAAYSESGDPDAARRCLDAAIAVAPGQPWCFFEKARLLRQSFDDVAGAAAVLRMCEANLEANLEAPGYQWSKLAEHFHSIADDPESARRCLDRGVQRARSVDDLCTMAQPYGTRLGDAPRAMLLLDRAEAMAREAATLSPEGIHEHWTLANAYSALGEEQAARRVLDEGLELAASLDACLTLAAAWSSLGTGHNAPVLRCIWRAESIVDSSQGWLLIAEAYHEHARDHAKCRKALERATEGADDTGLRRVAFGFAHWVGDDATARALAPRGVRPEELAVRRRPLEGWDADAGSLLASLLKVVTDEALDSIAAADYGFGRDDNRAALEDLRREGLAPIPMVSTLHEVMELTRWSSGERVDHVQRALACTLLCLDVLHENAFTESITATLAPLVESCWKLGPDSQRALAGFLVWLLEALRGAEEEAWEDDPDVGEEDLDSADSLAVLYGLLLTQLFLDPADPRLDALSTSVLELERRLNGWTTSEDNEAPWMSRVLRTINNAELWSELGNEALSRAAEAKPDSAAVRTLRPLLD